MSDSKESSSSRDGYCSCRLTEAREWLKKLLVEKAQVEREARRKMCLKKSVSIGQYKPQMRGAHFEEVCRQFSALMRRVILFRCGRKDTLSKRSNANLMPYGWK